MDLSNDDNVTIGTTDRLYGQLFVPSYNFEHDNLTSEELDKDLQLQWLVLKMIQNWIFPFRHYILLVFVPISCIFGNTLVVLAVYSTKSLQTPTNYLLVSLACADVLIGALVMPFSIYVSVSFRNMFGLGILGGAI